MSERPKGGGDIPPSGTSSLGLLGMLNEFEDAMAYLDDLGGPRSAGRLELLLTLKGRLRRLEALTTALDPFVRPRATTRQPDAAFVDKDILTIEVTVGDWWRALTTVGLFDAEMALMYAQFGPPPHDFSEGFIAELRAIAEAVRS